MLPGNNAQRRKRPLGGKMSLDGQEPWMNCKCQVGESLFWGLPQCDDPAPGHVPSGKPRTCSYEAGTGGADPCEEW